MNTPEEQERIRKRCGVENLDRWSRYTGAAYLLTSISNQYMEEVFEEFQKFGIRHPELSMFYRRYEKAFNSFEYQVRSMFLPPAQKLLMDDYTTLEPIIRDFVETDDQEQWNWQLRYLYEKKKRMELLEELAKLKGEASER